MQEFRVDVSDLLDTAKAFETFPQRTAVSIIARTLNYIGDKARTKVVRATAERVGLPYRDIRQAIATFRASPRGLAYELNARGGYLTLRRFNPTQTRTGVTARPWGRRQEFRGGFIVRSLPPLAFVRVGRSRLPIRAIYGPAIPIEMLRGEVPAQSFETARAEAPARFQHEVEYALSKGKGFFETD
jgi:hypothetical protein